MKVNKLLRCLSLPLCAMGLAACGTGATSVQGGVLLPYARLGVEKPERVYAGRECQGKGGTVLNGPDGVEYEFRRAASGRSTAARPVLVEHTYDEPEVRLIRNGWSGEDGARHFFVWLPGARGFEYIIPADAGKPAQRRIYSAPQVQKVKGPEGAAMRPLGAPDVVCQLLPR
jgi:hypothetical protein